ncbi:MAG: SDR family NAD(P)-dependent oxidoreductase, partial [Pseudomonadota bacterium]
MSEQDQEFRNRTALVTGGSRGIGRAICLALAEKGANVALNYVQNRDAAAKVKHDIEATGSRCGIYRADVSDPKAVEAMVADVAEEIGPVEFLVTAAGIAHLGDHTEVDLGLWQQIMRVNV